MQMQMPHMLGGGDKSSAAKWIGGEEALKIEEDLKHLDNQRMEVQELSYRVRKMNKLTDPMDTETEALFIEIKELKESKTCFLNRLEAEIRDREGTIQF